MRDSRALLIKSSTDFPPVNRAKSEILQVNLGYLCNLSCVHCHVNAGPTRTEMMDDETLSILLEIIETGAFRTLDLTGGAPEMHPAFSKLVLAARAKNMEVIDRCNLTILLEPGYEDMAAFLAANKVRVVASLPCYLEENVDKQRGKGVYHSSIDAIRKLNALGYGYENSASAGLILDLVYNPVGAHLPPPQQSLQQDYKRELAERFDIHFNQLLTITNMPISRFGAVLLSQGDFEPYMALLRENFNAQTLPSLMCRNTISVDYRGRLYDCDFNQMLAFPMKKTGRELHLRDLLETNIEGIPVAIADHCFGCTAGAGSSCGGALN
ncbi:MAG: arsenosugar biosynthesis radical SAM protein ArsS [Alcanivoracaceae bacterium]|nr:arsenosugar biosynthesis radical SAM protein ArsS [Alcanivoracaceae bacterium]